MKKKNIWRNPYTGRYGKFVLKKAVKAEFQNAWQETKKCPWITGLSLLAVAWFWSATYVAGLPKHIAVISTLFILIGNVVYIVSKQKR